MRVAKWGNSLAVRLPNKLVEEMELRAGDEIEVVRVIQKTIEIEKSERRAAALERMARRAWPAPPGYTFDREEANER